MKTLSIFRFAVPAALAVAALALSGCSSSEAKKAEAEESPLQKYISALYDDEQYSQEYSDKQHAKGEELIAKCMAKEGFEYTPTSQSGGMVTNLDYDEAMEGWGTLKFAETYGYGIVDNPVMQGPLSGGQEVAAEQSADSHQKYVDSLSESEQNAYYETLWGPQPSLDELEAMDEVGESMEGAHEVSGCSGAAQGEDPYDSASEDPEFKDLFAKMDQVYSATYDEDGNLSNKELLKLDRDWSACMAKGGYDFADPAEVQMPLSDEWSRLNGLTVERTAHGSSATLKEGDTPKEPSKAEKEKFQEKEIKTAVADRKCRDKLDYEGTQQRVYNEIEQRFVDQNKAKLDAMLVKYGTKKRDK